MCIWKLFEIQCGYTDYLTLIYASNTILDEERIVHSNDALQAKFRLLGRELSHGNVCWSLGLFVGSIVQMKWQDCKIKPTSDAAAYCKIQNLIRRGISETRERRAMLEMMQYSIQCHSDTWKETKTVQQQPSRMTFWIRVAILMELHHQARGDLGLQMNYTLLGSRHFRKATTNRQTNKLIYTRSTTFKCICWIGVAILMELYHQARGDLELQMNYTLQFLVTSTNIKRIKHIQKQR